MSICANAQNTNNIFVHDKRNAHRLKGVPQYQMYNISFYTILPTQVIIIIIVVHVFGLYDDLSRLVCVCVCDKRLVSIRKLFAI